MFWFFVAIGCLCTLFAATVLFYAFGKFLKYMCPGIFKS